MRLDRIVDFVAGVLTPQSAYDVEKHMALCGDCRVLVVELARKDLQNLRGTKDQGRTLANEVQPKTDPISSSQGGTIPAYGASVGRYTLLYPLGRGGMGSVYAAFDPKLDRRVALKFLHNERLGGGGAIQRERLVREARALARLSHPNVVGIYDVADGSDRVYLAMELIEGMNARVWQEVGHRTIEEITKTYHQALRGLCAAHDQGIIHRDFKPDNVMVGADGVARVTDFGLARSALSAEDDGIGVPHSAAVNWKTLTQSGHILGTPRYMAPEQFRGCVDAKTDQFAFCLSMYEALYGHYPLGTKTPNDLLRLPSIESQLLEPLGREGIPDALRYVLLRGMSVSPEDRWRSMTELEAELTSATAAKRPGVKRWLGFSSIGIAALIGALAFAPGPPPSVLTDMDRYEEELTELRRQVAAQDQAGERLATSLERIAELERTLKEREERLQLVEDEPQALPRPAIERPIRMRLPVRSVERAVTTRLGEVLNCYEQSVLGNDEVNVSVRLGVRADGGVEWVTRPFQGDRAGSSCLKAALSHLTFPERPGATAVTLFLTFFRLESDVLAVSMRAETRLASLGKVTVDSKGRILVDCDPEQPLCGLE